MQGRLLIPLLLLCLLLAGVVTASRAEQLVAGFKAAVADRGPAELSLLIQSFDVL